MFPSTTFKEYYPRRMLLNYSPLMHAQAPSPSNYQSYAATSKNGTSFDNIDVMIFSILLCLLVFTIFVNCMIRCLLKCLTWFNNTRQVTNNNNNILVVHNNNNNNNNNNKVVVNTGVHKRTLKTFHVVKYSKEVKLQGLSSGECVICLSEFKEGKKVRILPKCNHGFHVKCIDKWLESHTSCPTCRQSLVDTCQKIIGCDDHDHQPTSSSSRGMVGNLVISIESLEREDFARD